MKNIEELKSWFEDDKLYVGEYVKHKINQLDEPETLSGYWIEQKSIDTHVDTLSGEVQVTFRLNDLENLLVPKRELPAIPKFVAEYLDLAKSEVTLMRVLELANTRNELPKWEKEYDWISANDETFARAWLDGFTVEQEQKYNVKLKVKSSFGTVGIFLYKKGDEVLAGDNFRNYYPKEEEYMLTEQEIRGFQSGDILFEHFAKPVEGLEE